MISRRSIAIGSLAAASRYAAVHAQSVAVLDRGQDLHGCWIAEEDASIYLARSVSLRQAKVTIEERVSHSASRMLDYAFAQALASIGRRFEIKPGFSYIKEPENEGPNAYATAKSIGDAPNGTVLFGLAMLSSLLGRSQFGDISIMAVAAHEFGHVVALNRGLSRRLSAAPGSPFASEQFADFMSGYYAAVRHTRDSSFPAVAFAQTMSDLGGATRGTHGTRQERGRAVLNGYQFGFQRDRSIGEAAQAGLQYAVSIASRSASI